MKIFLYNSFILILLPVIITRIFFKSIKDKDYIRNFFNRFGIYKTNLSKEFLWFHAVSLGEVIGSKSILKNLIKDHSVVLSVSTPTGFREAKKIYKNDIEIVFAPWDFYLFILLFIKKFKPKALILFETEIWPTIIFMLNSRKIPIILSNARLSESSYKNYSFLKFFFRDIFKMLTLVLAQAESDKLRFEKMGIPNKKLKTVGSVKFDSETIKFQNTQLDEKFILATSTHEGEEQILIDSFENLQNEFPDMKLVLVPRHPERCSSVAKLFLKKDISYEIFENIPQDFKNKDAFIIKSTGVLNQLYSISQISFVGGSLIDKYGGHNIIEPAANECSFIVGPYMKNFEGIIDLFIEKNACIVANSSKELTNAFASLLKNNELRQNMIHNALSVVEENKGASNKQLRLISELLY